MAAESGRLLAGQGKRSKGRTWFSPILPIRFGVIHYCAAMGCNGAVSKIPSRPLPYVNFTTVSGGGCFPTELICERGSMSLLLSVYISPIPVFHVLMSSSPPVSLIDLTSLPVLRPLSPLSPGSFWSAWVIFSSPLAAESRLHYLGDDTAWMFSILSSCPSMSPSLNSSQLLDLRKRPQV